MAGVGDIPVPQQIGHFLASGTCNHVEVIFLDDPVQVGVPPSVKLAGQFRSECASIHGLSLFVDRAGSEPPAHRAIICSSSVE